MSEDDGADTDALRTPLCRRLGIRSPIVQAPIGSVANPRLAAAVSNAGGLGTLALSWTPVDGLLERLRETRRLTPRPFAANLVLEWSQHDRLAACLELETPIVSTFWGDPGPYVGAIREARATHVHTVGSVREAVQAVEAGVDVVVAQGWEAGGHVRGEVSTLALVPAVVDAVAPVPVIAAGGIADGRGLLAALALGAQAAWMGTRFLVATEADAHPVYAQAVLRATDADTVHSSLFDGGWPGAPHRTLRNSTVAAWEAAGRPAPSRRPGEGETVARSRDGRALRRYDDAPPVRGLTGDPEALALYAGQGAALVREPGSARDIVEQTLREARAGLTALRRP